MYTDGNPKSNDRFRRTRNSEVYWIHRNRTVQIVLVKGTSGGNTGRASAANKSDSRTKTASFTGASRTSQYQSAVVFQTPNWLVCRPRERRVNEAARRRRGSGSAGPVTITQSGQVPTKSFVRLPFLLLLFFFFSIVFVVSPSYPISIPFSLFPSLLFFFFDASGLLLAVFDTLP